MAKQDLVITFKGEDTNLSKVLNDIIKRLDTLDSEVEQTTEAINENTRKMATGFKKFGDGMTGMSQRVAKAFSGMSTKIIAALGVGGLVGAMTKAIKTASEFETAMAEVATLLGEDAEESIQFFNEQIRELSKQSNASATSLSKGLYQVISAGTKGVEDNAKAMELLTIAQRAGTAGASDTFTAVDVLTTSLNAYEMSAEEAQKFSDILFTTIKLGKTTLNELGSQMGNVASVAAGAGVQFEEVNAAFAALTKSMGSTDRAATSLSGLISVMLSPSKELEKAVLGLGKGYTSVGDALEKEGLVGMMKILRDLTGGNAEAMSKLIPNIQAMRGAAVLAGTGLENLISAFEEMQNASGATDAAYEKMSKTLSFQTARFGNIIEDMFRAVGMKLGPALTSFLEGISDWFDKYGPSIAQWLTDVGEFLGMITDELIRAVKWWAELFNGIVRYFQQLFTMIDQLISRLAPIRQLKKDLKEIADFVTGADQSAAIQAEFARAAAARRGQAALQAQTQATPGMAEFVGPVAPATDVGKKPLVDPKKVEAAAKLLERLEMNVASARKKALLAFQKLRDDIQKANFAKEEDRQRALFLARKKFQKEIALLDEKAAKDKAKQEEEEFKLMQKEVAWRKRVDAQFAEAQSRMIEQRAAWQEEMEKRGLIGPSMGERAMETVMDVGVVVQKMVSEVGVGFLREIGTRLVNVVTNAFSIAFAPIQKITEIFGAIMSGGGLDQAQEMVQGATQFFANLTENLGPTLEWFANEGVPMILNSFVENLPIIIDALVENIPIILDHIIANLGNIIVPLVEGILTLIPKLIERIPDLIREFVKMIPHITAAIIRAIPDIVFAFIEAIPEIIAAFIAELPSLAWEVAKALVDAIFGILKKASPTGALGLDIIPDEVPIVGKLLHSGGMISRNMNGFNSAVADFSRAARAHSGVYIGQGMGSQEVPIIAKVGEAVMNENFVNNVGGKEAVDEMNRTGKAGTNVVNNYLQVEHMMSNDTRQVIDDMVGQNLTENVGQTNQIMEDRYRASAKGFKPRLK